MRFPVPAGVQLQTDMTPAQWVVQRLWSWEGGARVASFVPEGFDAYARIFHPAYQHGNDVATQRWSALAEGRGKVLTPEIGFGEVSGFSSERAANWDDAVPADGCLPRRQCRFLVLILEDFTSAPDDCWFCVWSGYGFWGEGISYDWSRAWRWRERRRVRDQAKRERRFLAGVPEVRAYNREYYLFRGPISRAASFDFPMGYQSPNLWWPADRSWCVATEIDAYSTYVGGSRGCIDQILRSPDLEALEVPLDARLDPG